MMMERFDREWKSVDSEELEFRKVGRGILVFFGIIFAVVPFDWVGAYTLLIWCMIAWMYSEEQVVILEDNKRISIYKVLKWTPISKKEIQSSRMRRMNRFVLKWGLLVGVAQQFGVMYLATWSPKYLLVGVVVTLAMWLTGVGVVVVGR